MLTLTETCAPVAKPHATLTLPFDHRKRSRLRVTLSTGEEAALLLPRGGILRGGDHVRSAEGHVVRIVAARERVSVVTGYGAGTLLRAAYHLGNRHVELEVGHGYLRYLEDHVLDAMVEQLGLAVSHENEPFEPEPGAYAHVSHDHDHQADDEHHADGHEHTH